MKIATAMVLESGNVVDLTHWFCWVTVAGAIIGLIAAVQQLLMHGWKPFVRAATVTLVIGVALTFVYPSIQAHMAGGEAPASPAAEAMPIEPAPLLPPAKPLEPPPLPPARTPIESATVKSVRAASAAFKAAVPTFLTAQQMQFTPSEVAYCPLCFSAYSCQGATVGVTCVHCNKEVNLVSSTEWMVYRCGKCGTLYRTTHFPPPIGPYRFQYYCSFCKEYHWYPH
jgi:hypothetical protein